MQKVKKKIDEGSLMRKKIIEKYEKDREESENILKLIKVDIVSQISKVA